MSNRTIKLTQVKTLRELNIVSDRWYNRAHYLKSIFYNESIDQKTRQKAFKAWLPYYYLLTNISMLYFQIPQEESSNIEFESGGIIGTVQEGEVIINK